MTTTALNTLLQMAAAPETTPAAPLPLSDQNKEAITKTLELFLVRDEATKAALEAENYYQCMVIGEGKPDREAINLIRPFNGEKYLKIFLANGINYQKDEKEFHTTVASLLPFGEVRLLNIPPKFSTLNTGTAREAVAAYIEYLTRDFKTASSVQKAEAQEAAAKLIGKITRRSVRDIEIKSHAALLEIGVREFQNMCSRYVDNMSAKITQKNIERFPYIKVKDTFLQRQPAKDTDTGEISWRYVQRKKDELKDEIGGAEALKAIPRFTDYIAEYSHTQYRRVVTIEADGKEYKFFNSYEPLQHVPQEFELPQGFKEDPINFDLTQIKEIENTMKFFVHLYRGENKYNEKWLNIGLDYVAILYLHPAQRLPAQALVSKEEGTGKSTFLALLAKIFGANAIKNEGSRIGAKFNDMTKNKLLVYVEETKDDRGDLENLLKDLITSTERVYETKNQAAEVLRTVEKYIFASNHPDSFLKVGTQTTRFFISQIAAIETKEPDFEQKLYLEIPYFLYFLEKRGVISPKKDRLWFHPSQLENEALEALRNASKDIIQQNLENLIEQMFLNTEYTEPVLKLNTAYIKELLVRIYGKMYEGKTLNYFHKSIENQLDIKQSASPTRFEYPLLLAVKENKNMAIQSEWTFEDVKTNGKYFSFPIWRFVSVMDVMDTYNQDTAKRLLTNLAAYCKKNPDDAKAKAWGDEAARVWGNMYSSSQEKIPF